MDNLLSTADAAMALGVSRRHVQRFIKTKRLTAIKMADCFFITRADLEAFAQVTRTIGRPRKGDGQKD